MIRPCIVIPVYQKMLTASEAASLKQAFHVLHKHPIVIVKPESLTLPSEFSGLNFKTITFSDHYFSSIEGYNRLLLHPKFYLKFLSFSHMLIYQLDAWVFRDELEQWCKKGYDYIGAPWFEGWDHAKPGAVAIGVGNGGFSLRRISSQLRALFSFSYLKPKKELTAEYIKGLRSRMELIRDLSIRNNTFFLFNTFIENEDHFFGLVVTERFAWYKVAPVDEALKFSLETNPSYHYKGLLPFGCHAWQRYEPEFWSKYITI